MSPCGEPALATSVGALRGDANEREGEIVRFTPRGRRLRALTVLGLMASVVVALPVTAQAVGPAVFVNEIHYDNVSTDQGEAIEIAGPAGTDLTDWSLVLYNGSGGAVYDTLALGGVLGDQQNGFGTLAFTATGLQNGGPDGIALVDETAAVVEFISYEGTFTAVGGPAAGMLSVDIGVAEASDSTVGHSLQKSGTGLMGGDFSWAASQPNTFGAVNTGQTFAEGGPTPVFIINEVDADQVGTDSAEFVEIYDGGVGGASLTGLVLVLFNGATDLSYDAVDLDGFTTDADGYFVVCGDAANVATCDLDALPNTNAIQNGVDAVALYTGNATDFPTGTAVTTDDLLDALVYDTNDADDLGLLVLLNAGQPQVDEGGGAGGSTLDSNQRCPDGSGGARNTDTYAQFAPSPSEANPCAIPTPCAAGGLFAISLIQGTTDVTPCAGDVVTIEGVVVGDYEGPSPELRGFYVQEEDGDHDADPATSEGIFVFNFDNDSVDLGDLVSVTGTAAEFQGQTQLGSVSAISVLDTGQTVTAATASLPVPTLDHFERFEGMLVVFDQTLYVSEFFQLGRFGEIVVSSGDRLPQPTANVAPGAPAIAMQAANNLNRLKMDDDLNNQNADPILFGRGGNPLSASNTLRGGDTITGTVGVMTYTWAGNSASGNAYRLRPVGDLSDSGLVPGGVVPDFQAANPRPAGPPSVGGSLEVASFNVLNYFVTLDEGANQCGPVGFEQECRGAESALELDRQRTKLLAALVQLDADVLGLIEQENSDGVEPLADIVAGLNDVLGAGTYDYVDTGTIGTDVIKVGIIYKPGSVTPYGAHAVLDSSVDPAFDDELNRPALAQSFLENASGEVFTVVVNHLKSKGCGGATGDEADQFDGQGCWNPARTRAAAAEVAWLDSDPTGSGDDDVLVIGDLNAYAMEDPVAEFLGGGYVDLVAALGGPDPYSFAFDGQWGYLDYALASPSLAGQVTGAADYHINADEPSVLDYNTNFKSAGQIDSLFAPDEFRTSDHDPVVIGLDLDFRAKLKANPKVLWPPNHKYVKVKLSARVKWWPLSVQILEVVSSEPDSTGPTDPPNDIVILGPNKLKLRAERYSDDGRTYAITAVVSGKGQVKVMETTVVVPHRRPRR